MKTPSIPFTEAKAHLSKYGRLAEQGHVTLVLKHNRSAFVIAPVPQPEQARPKNPGIASGRIHMAPDFDTTPEEVVAAFEGSL
jgi:antitoxin (DNA-binding transcriptional repressor) of toxin-antitoxin stability system